MTHTTTDTPRSAAVRCAVCGYRRDTRTMRFAIPNLSKRPKASGPLVVDDPMCRDCATMFGGWPEPPARSRGGEAGQR
jgi:hypothetical protein